jgi:hypothetical protein
MAPGQTGLAAMPDAEYGKMALSFAKDLRDDFVERDRIYNLIDEVIFLEQKVQIPDNYKQTAVEVRTPLPMHIANSITSALSINNPRVIFKPIEFGDPGEDAAAYRERFFMGSWLRQQREKKRRIYRSFMHSVVTKGEGILKTFERKQRAWAKYVSQGVEGQDGYAPGFAAQKARELDGLVARGELDGDARDRLFDSSTEEYKRGLPYPIETTEIPPETYYYQQGEDGLTRVAEIKEVPYYDTLKLYGASFDTNGRVCFDTMTGLAIPDTEWHRAFGTTNRRTIQMVELWDYEYCTIVLRGPGDFPSSGSSALGSGCLVQRYRHTYGDPVLKVLRGPYFHASGILTSSRVPHKRSLSVLFAYLHLFPLLNSLLTMQSQAAFSFAYPAYRRTTPPTYGLPETPFGFDATELQASREKIVPGGIFPHDIAPMDQPRTSVDLDKAISFVRSMIDMALPDSVQGNVTGEMAGYTLNQAARLVSLQWSPIVENVQDALAERVGWESHLIETHIGEPVYVWGAIPQPRRRRGSPRLYKDGWMGIGPKELKGAHNYEIVLEPVSINNEQLLLRNLRDKLDMRLITPADAIRAVGGNPVEVERGWLLHELKQDQEIRKNLKQRIFQELGTIEQEAMRALPPEGQPGGEPPLDTSALPAGAQPGVSQGLPTTGFVPPAGATPAAPPAEAPPMSLSRPPGTVSGEPGPLRGVPQQHQPIPGGG